MNVNKRFTWLKKDVYAPQVVITDSLTGKDLTPTDCYELLNNLHEENNELKEKYNEQSVEYEGLEEQVERLQDFKDKVFNLINAEIRRGEQIIDGGERIGANVSPMIFHIVLLNRIIIKLEEENSSWQKTASHMDTIAREDREFSKRLYKENQQLKQQLTDCKEKKQQMKEFFMNSEPVIEQKKLQELIYQIVINLIDEKIKEADEGFEQTYDSWYQGQIDALKELKKELQE
jgi:DNA repair exonuclease SbcCD ATPase subunit